MADSEKLSANLLLDYLVELGSGLMSAGCPTYRLEELLGAVAAREGFTCDVFAVPTGLFVSVRTPEGDPTATQLVRVRESRTNLGLLASLDEVLNLVATRELGVTEARGRIRELMNQRPIWPAWAQLLAGMGACGGGAVFFGGGWSDFFLGGLGGLVLLGIIRAGRGTPELRVLENFLGGAVAGLIAWVTTLLWPSHSREVLVLAIVIPLLPGMVLTTGLSELTHRDLVAGTSRLMEAAVTLLSLVFGIALVLGLEAGMGFHPAPVEPAAPASLPWQVLALVVASVSFGVLLGLPRRWLGVALASGAVVWVTTLLTRHLPASYAAFATASVLAIGANLYARTKERPAQLFLLPGLLLLVPGAFGFRSLDALLRGDYTAGATQFADMLLTAGALVMGLLVANVVLPPRKIL